jgi:hypothetical protein
MTRSLRYMSGTPKQIPQSSSCRRVRYVNSSGIRTNSESQCGLIFAVPLLYDDAYAARNREFHSIGSNGHHSFLAFTQTHVRNSSAFSLTGDCPLTVRHGQQLYHGSCGKVFNEYKAIEIFGAVVRDSYPHSQYLKSTSLPVEGELHHGSHAELQRPA